MHTLFVDAGQILCRCGQGLLRKMENDRQGIASLLYIR